MCQNEPGVYRMTFWQCRPTSLALWQTERDDSREMQKLSDTAHLAKAHPSTGNLTTSAPRLTWAGDKGPPVSLGRDLSLQLLSGSAIPSLPPSVLLSFYREVKVQGVCAGVWVREAGGTENLCHSPLAVVSWQTGPGLQLCLPRSLWCPQVQSRPGSVSTVPAAHAANMKPTSYLSVMLLMKIDVCFHHLAASYPLLHSTYVQWCEH